MKKTALFVAMAVAGLASGVANATVVLTGHDLTPELAWRIAQGERVEISDKALAHVKKSYDFVMTAARQGAQIYGLTVGVGLNKDVHLFDAHGKMTEEAKAASRAFNKNIIRADVVGYPPYLSDELSRLSMVIRLNTLLRGRAGVTVELAERYRDFLNLGITPLIPSRGSIGDADITLASHIGSVMMGEWQAKVDGKVVDGAQALKMKGLKPYVPEGKDGLAVISSNCVGMALTMDALRTLERVVAITPTVYALSLEGMNGNVAPFLRVSANSHPLAGFPDAAKDFRDVLKGSYLWKADQTRALQDPLSFRTSVYAYGEVKQAYNELKKMVVTQINNSDDNPGVIADLTKEELKDFEHEQVKGYLIEADGIKGAIVPSANFEPLAIAISAQKATLALAHLAHNTTHRTMRMDEPYFSGLSRFLAGPENKLGHAFGATEDTMVSVYAENVDLANPVSLDGAPVEGSVEDSASNLPRVAERLQRAASNMIDLYSMEIMHSTQAVDLRKMTNKKVKLSEKTQKLYDAYRAKVPFFDQDRNYTPALLEGIELLKNYKIK